MAVDQNNTAKAGLSSRTNSKSIGYSSKPQRRKQGFARWTFNTAARLTVWYAIYVALFTCPSSVDQLVDDSSIICRPYLHAKAIVSPHVQPYYDAYVAPYTELAQPYVKPVWDFAAPHATRAQEFGQAQWDKTVKPQLESAQDLIKKQFDASVGPQFDKAYTAASPYIDNGKERLLYTYDHQLLPAYRASQPYAQKLYTTGEQVAVGIVYPYAEWLWTSSTGFLHRSIWPQIRILYGMNVEPQLVRISERLARYREKRKIASVVAEAEASLTRPAEQKSKPTVAGDSDTVSNANEFAEFESPETIIGPLLKDDRLKQDLEEWKQKFIRAADTAADELEERTQEITDRQIKNGVEGVGEAIIIQLQETIQIENERLKTKVNKLIFGLSAESSDEESDEVEAQVARAVRAAGLQVREHAQALRGWKQNFDYETAKLVFDQASSATEILNHVLDLGLQEVGMRWAWMDNITYLDWKKYHAMKDTLSEWKTEVEEVATKHQGVADAKVAADDVEARGMAMAEEAAAELARLKEVGVWKVRAQDSSDDWTTRKEPPVRPKPEVPESDEDEGVFESVAAQASEKVAEVVSAASEKIADAGATIKEASEKASAAIVGTPSSAPEKIVSAISEQPEKVKEAIKSAGGAKPVMEAVSSSAQSIASKAGEVVGGSPKPAGESIVSEISHKVSEAVLGSSTPAAESIISKISEGGNSAASSVQSVVSAASDSLGAAISDASTAVVGTSTPGYESAASKVSSKVDAAASSIKKAVVGSDIPVHESVVSAASKQAKSAASAASSVVAGSSTPVTEAIAESASSVASEASSIVKSASSKVFAGAMAAEVQPRIPIFDQLFMDDDDDESYGEQIASMISEAGDKYADITKAVVEALSPTATQGSVESITSVASKQYASALEAASKALYGKEQGNVESITSVAASRYAEAVAAASSAIYGTPTPASEALVSAAQAQYSEAVRDLQRRYNKAKSMASAQISGTPKPAYEETLENIESAYSSAVAAASTRFDAVVNAASQQIYPTQPLSPQYILDSANRKYSEALAAASSQLEIAKSRIGATNTPAQESLFSAASSRYSEAAAAATSQYAVATSKARSLVFGPPAGTFESISSAASSRLSDSISKASEQFSSVKSAIGATDAPLYSQYSAEAQRRYHEGVGMAYEQYSQFVTAASTAMYGTPTGTFESLVSAASAHAASLADAASTAVIGSETPWYESVASQAAADWSVAVSRVSDQVYGSPTPFGQSLYSQGGALAAQATQAAASQFAEMQSLFSELVSGREPAFTESAMNRLSSAYYTAMPSFAASASSYAGEAYDSALSAVSAAFTPPPALESILASVSEQFDAAIEAASAQLLEREPGVWDKATSVAAEGASAASEAVFGHETGSVEAAQSQIEAAASVASRAMSEALFGTTTGYVEAATRAAADAAHEAQSKASAAVYGQEVGAMESAAARLADVVEQAKARLAAMGDGTQSRVEEVASSISSVVSEATDRVKDEL